MAGEPGTEGQEAGADLAQASPSSIVLVQQFYQDNGELFVELGGPREVNVTDAELDLLESAQEIIFLDDHGGYFALASEGE